VKRLATVLVLAACRSSVGPPEAGLPVADATFDSITIDQRSSLVTDAPEPRCAGVTPARVIKASLVTTRTDAAALWSIALDVPAIGAHLPFMNVWPMHACKLHVDERSIRFACETGEGPLETEARIQGHTLYVNESATSLPCDASLRFDTRNPCKDVPAITTECH